MELLITIGAILITGVIVFLISRKSQSSESNNQVPEDYNKLKSDLDVSIREKSLLEGKHESLLEEKTRLLAELNDEREGHDHVKNRLAKAEEIFHHKDEKIKELQDLHEKVSKDFENIANRVIKQSSDEITKRNEERMQDVLKPFKENIKSFEEKIDKSGKEREGLKEQIMLLHDLNKNMAEEAKNLTQALKGDSKKRGNWGEVVLERVLEDSGLIKGQEYETEYTTENQDGSRIRPDVIIKLPEDKHIIVDSKLSLVAYETYSSSDDDEERAKALKMHIDAVKLHVKQLSEKSYQTSKDFHSPDFVLMFMPIEAAFSVAIQGDADLFSYAWDKKIVIVSPTTLLATLRTISSIWKQERQTKNALEIARQSGALYDKFVGFVKDLKDIEKSIDKSRESYDKAWNKLSDGRGNLIHSVEKIKKLGAKAEKKLDGEISEELELGTSED